MGSSSKAAVTDGFATMSDDGDDGATTETDNDVIDAVDSSPFAVGEKVLAYHASCLYEAKVQEVEFQMGKFRYLIHYLGWKKSWDEWVFVDHLLKVTEENIQKQKELFLKHGRGKITRPGNASLAKHLSSSATGKKQKSDTTAKGKSTKTLEKSVDIHIPSSLKKQLVDECESITHMGKLVKLPRNPNVDNILNKYLAYRSKDGKVADTVAEILSGLRCYFDKSLPVMLLYKSERQQYQDAIRDGISPATLYGAEHLLRLFVKLPEILYAAKIEEDTLKELQQELKDFLKFLQRNQGTFFLSAYQKPGGLEVIPGEQRE